VLYDLFISYSSEDRETFVRPFAKQLRKSGFRLWYDEFELKPGDRLSESIDYGLSHSKAGIVVLSPSFLGRQWPKRELSGLTSLQMHGKGTLIPLLYGISISELLEFSPPLADVKCLIGGHGIEKNIEEIERVVKPSKSLWDEMPIDQAIEYFDRGEEYFGLVVACHALDNRLFQLYQFHKSHHYSQDEPEEHIRDPRAAMDLLLSKELLNTRYSGEEIDIDLVKEVFKYQGMKYNFAPFMSPKAEDALAIVKQVQKFMRANRMPAGDYLDRGFL